MAESPSSIDNFEFHRMCSILGGDVFFSLFYGRNDCIIFKSQLLTDLVHRRGKTIQLVKTYVDNASLSNNLKSLKKTSDITVTLTGNVHILPEGAISLL